MAEWAGFAELQIPEIKKPVRSNLGREVKSEINRTLVVLP
jgi:hypothetical protein